MSRMKNEIQQKKLYFLPEININFGHVGQFFNINGQTYFTLLRVGNVEGIVSVNKQYLNTRYVLSCLCFGPSYVISWNLTVLGSREHSKYFQT